MGETPSRSVFIHIGKCGGLSARDCFERNGIRFDEVVHIRKPAVVPGWTYHIVARNPVGRALSAFNWRYRLVVDQERQRDRFPGEYDILSKYGTLNSLAESLYDAAGAANPEACRDFRHIHHLGESIDFYLGGLLRDIDPMQIAGVMMQETLADDMFRLFGVRPEKRLNSARACAPPERLALSPRAASNLERVLAPDFRCLQILRSWGKISPDGIAQSGLDL
jgi:hypothetical protein